MPPTGVAGGRTRPPIPCPAAVDSAACSPYMVPMQIRTLFAGTLLIAALAAVGPAPASGQTTKRLALDDLSTSKVGDFPKRWRTWPLQRSAAERVYSVAEDGGKRFIKAYDAEDASQQIFLNFSWALAERPVLSWRWRATTLPQGANESSDATNDSACGVYVAFGRTGGNAIKYVWSATLSPGTVVTRRGGKLKIKVLDAGSARVGAWVAHTANVLADYEQLFGAPPDRDPGGIGILTDGNAVHKPAGCDYADFAIEGAK
jgi:hypothetical protein